MVERVSSLEGFNAPRETGRIGESGPGVTLSERRIGSLWQIAAWPDRLAAAGEAAANAAGVAAAPGPGQSDSGTATLIRTEPLKFWLASDDPLPRPDISAEDGTVLDQSHARTVIRVTGPHALDLMARAVPVDLRPVAFPEGAVASTGLHHVGVTILARGGGYDIFTPRSFALSLWEHLIEIAAQFGVEIA